MPKDTDTGYETRMVAVTLIADPKFNSRTYYDNNATTSLAQSLREQGQKQPIVITPIKSRTDSNGNTVEFELIIGSRRLLATKLNGTAEIWAAIKPTDAKGAKVDNIIENLQREDLSSFERARSFAELATEEGMSVEQITAVTGYGKSRISALIAQFQSMPPGLKARWEQRDSVFTAQFLEAINKIQVPELKEKFYKQRKALELKSNKDPSGEELVSQDEYAALLKSKESNGASSVKTTQTIKIERYTNLRAGITRTRGYSKEQKELALSAIDYLMGKSEGIPSVDVTSGAPPVESPEVVVPRRKPGRPSKKEARN